MDLLDKCEGRPKFFTPYKLFVTDFFASYNQRKNTSLQPHKICRMGWNVASNAWKDAPDDTKAEYEKKSIQVIFI